ncbi:Transposase for insertion sequence element IS257 in transposon Tn4003 [Bacillus mycoides]|nr:Transposase for insertion sequence element IS257 in transposon Tn4003 [Bacillus mycoides]EEL02836.1 Transposase [Bacillus cereus BDRD-ST196]
MTGIRPIEELVSVYILLESFQFLLLLEKYGEKIEIQKILQSGVLHIDGLAQ